MQNSPIHQPPQLSRMTAFLDSPKMIRNPILVFNEYRSALGETFSFHFGGVKKAIVSSNPLFIQHVLKTNYENYHKSDIQMKRMGHFLGKGLLTSHGKYWLTQRRLIQQGFHKTQLAALIHIMQAVLDESLTAFDQEISREPVDIYPAMMKMTFSSVTRSLFSTSLKAAEIGLLSNTISAIQEFMVRQIVQPYLDPWFRLTGELRKYELMRHRSDKVILDYIITRRKDQLVHNDMLQILMDAVYEDTGTGMSDTQLLSESMQLLVAGHETSSNVLSWTWYLLCRHPLVIKKIRDEIQTAIGEAPLQFTDISKLEYTTQVLEEVMRLYPPFWMIDREALKDDVAAGIHIPAGTMVISFVYGVHHSATYWDEPEKFIPERFSKENKKNHMPFTYIPFGGGPRGCIGGNYAMMQMLLILTTMIRKYDFELEENREIAMQPMIILRPKNGIKMKFTRLGRNQKIQF